MSLFSFIFSPPHRPYRHGVNLFHFKPGRSHFKKGGSICAPYTTNVQHVSRSLASTNSFFVSTYILFCLRTDYFEAARDTGLFLRNFVKVNKRTDSVSKTFPWCNSTHQPNLICSCSTSKWLIRHFRNSFS